jgi:hypothetical protein
MPDRSEQEGGKTRDSIRLALVGILLSAVGAVCADADGPDFFRG